MKKNNPYAWAFIIGVLFGIMWTSSFDIIEKAWAALPAGRSAREDGKFTRTAAGDYAIRAVLETE